MANSTNSHFLDGHYPGIRKMGLYQGGDQGAADRVVIQPATEPVQTGADEQEDKLLSLCQRASDMGIMDWVKRHQNTLIKVAAGYGIYRILRR